MANKPGKYAAFKKLYPKVPMEATQFERVREVLDASAFESGSLRVRDLDNSKLKDLYVQARKAKDELEVKLSVVQTQIDALTLLFTQRMEEEDVTSLTFTDGVVLGVSVEPYPTVNDPTLFYKWIKETGQEELLTLHPSTLAALTKQRLLEGESIPPGVEVWMKDKLRPRGINQKEHKHDTGN